MSTTTRQNNQTRFRTEGDVNASDRRTEWQDEHLDDATRQLLEEDATYFLHQALSPPCLNVVQQVDGIYLEDLQGRRIMDFHGNSVHQVGFSNPAVIDAIKGQLDALSFSTRRYTNRTAVDLAKKLTELAPGRLNRVLFAPSGALAIGMGNRVLMLEHSIYSVISPEGCASILWDNQKKVSQAAEALCMTAQNLLQHKIIDQIIPEPLGGAHRNHKRTANLLRKVLRPQLNGLCSMKPEQLISQRQEKFRNLGVFMEEEG